MKKRKIDTVNIILIIIIIVLITWLALSLGKDLFTSMKIEAENTKLSESVTDEASNTHDFAGLKSINSEITAWIKLDDTGIDFPIVQGTNNYKYLNTSASGEKAIQGAIFMDYRNDSNVKDLYTLIYGHHMSDGNMFGDISKFKDEVFFNNHLKGLLETTEEKIEVRCIAYLEVRHDNSIVYDPLTWNADNYNERLEWIKDSAINLREKEICNLIEDEQNRRIIALSTCTSYSKDMRSILLLEAQDTTIQK